MEIFSKIKPSHRAPNVADEDPNKLRRHGTQWCESLRTEENVILTSGVTLKRNSKSPVRAFKKDRHLQFCRGGLYEDESQQAPDITFGSIPEVKVVIHDQGRAELDSRISLISSMIVELRDEMSFRSSEKVANSAPKNGLARPG